MLYIFGVIPLKMKKMVLGQLPTGDNPPPDKNKAQLLPTRITIARTAPYNSPQNEYQLVKSLIRTNIYMVGNFPGWELSALVVRTRTRILFVRLVECTIEQPYIADLCLTSSWKVVQRKLSISEDHSQTNIEKSKNKIEILYAYRLITDSVIELFVRFCVRIFDQVDQNAHGVLVVLCRRHVGLPLYDLR